MEVALFPDHHVVRDPGVGGFREGGYQVGNRGRSSAVGVDLQRQALGRRKLLGTG